MVKQSFSVAFSVASLGIAVSGLIAAQSTPAGAAVLRYDLQVNVLEGPLTGQTYQGFFSYDDRAVAESQAGSFFPITDFEFNFAGRTFTRSDLGYDCKSTVASLSCHPLKITGGEWQPGRGGRPVYTAQGGTVAGFQFLSYNPRGDADNSFLIGYDGTQTSFLYNDNRSYPAYSGTISFQRSQPQHAPEPGFILGTLVSLGFLANARRRRPVLEQKQPEPSRLQGFTVVK